MSAHGCISTPIGNGTGSDSKAEVEIYTTKDHSLRLGPGPALLDGEFEASAPIPCFAGNRDQWLSDWSDTHCLVFTEAVVDPHEAYLAVARLGENWHLGRVYEEVFIEHIYLHLEPTPVVLRPGRP